MNYVSCIRINGTPILPPLLDDHTRAEVLIYKKKAIELEQKLKNKRRDTFKKTSDVSSPCYMEQAEPANGESCAESFLSVPESNKSNCNSLEEHEEPTRIRRNSYTLDEPSEALISCLKSLSSSKCPVSCYDTTSEGDVLGASIFNSNCIIPTNCYNNINEMEQKTSEVQSGFSDLSAGKDVEFSSTELYATAKTSVEPKLWDYDSDLIELYDVGQSINNDVSVGNSLLPDDLFTSIDNVEQLFNNNDINKRNSTECSDNNPRLLDTSNCNDDLNATKVFPYSYGVNSMKSEFTGQICNNGPDGKENNMNYANRYEDALCYITSGFQQQNHDTKISLSESHELLQLQPINCSFNNRLNFNLSNSTEKCTGKTESVNNTNFLPLTHDTEMYDFKKSQPEGYESCVNENGIKSSEEKVCIFKNRITSETRNDTKHGNGQEFLRDGCQSSGVPQDEQNEERDNNLVSDYMLSEKCSAENISIGDNYNDNLYDNISQSECKRTPSKLFNSGNESNVNNNEKKTVSDISDFKVPDIEVDKKGTGCDNGRNVTANTVEKDVSYEMYTYFCQQLRMKHMSELSDLLEQQKKEQEALVERFQGLTPDAAVDKTGTFDNSLSVSCPCSLQWDSSDDYDHISPPSTLLLEPLDPEISSDKMKITLKTNMEIKRNIEPHYHDTKKHKAATVLNAAVRGFLTRRLFKTEKVTTLIHTIKECLITAVTLQDEKNVNQLTLADLNLQYMILKQLTSSCCEVQEIFSLPVKERMSIIAADRERKKNFVPKRKSIHLPLTEATKQAIQRKTCDKKEYNKMQNGRRTGRCVPGSYSEFGSVSDKHTRVGSEMGVKKCRSVNADRKPWR